MKIHKQLFIDGKPLAFTDEVITLAQNQVGRALFSVKEDDAVTYGAKVEFNAGAFDDFNAVFLGYIEKINHEKNGYLRIFAREACGALEAPIKLSARHCTLSSVIDNLNRSYPVLHFTTNRSADYATTPIPLLNHSGSALQLLNNLGRYFSVPDYFWTQYPDGSLFVGSLTDSPESESESSATPRTGAGGTSERVTVPYNSNLRAGQRFNGAIVRQVTHRGDFSEIEWQEEGESALRRQILREFPELDGGYHLGKMAEVISVSDPAKGGEIADPFRPHYAVDVRLLDDDGNPDLNAPIFEAVPLPVAATASQGGAFAFPEVGTCVELGFIGGRSDRPVIRNFYPTGKTVPAVAVGEVLNQQRPGVYDKIDAHGNRETVTDQSISEQSAVRNINAESENRQVGQRVMSVEADNSENVGGNESRQILGNQDAIIAGNKSETVGGDFSARVQGVASLIVAAKAELKAAEIEASAEKVSVNTPLAVINAQKIAMGNGGANVLRILEELLQIVADLATTTANHTHPGSHPPNQSADFAGFATRAGAARGRLSPMIAD